MTLAETPRQEWNRLFPPDTRPFILLDAGMGTECERRGADVSHELWSTKVLIDTPEVIRQVHEANLAAGADIIGTCTYQTSDAACRRYLCCCAEDDDDDETKKEKASACCAQVVAKAVDIAHKSVDSFVLSRSKTGVGNDQTRPRPLIGACIGPLGASLVPSGAEYTGDYGGDDFDAKPLEERQKIFEDFHIERLRAVVHQSSSSSPSVDVIMLETMPRLDEVMTLLSLLQKLNCAIPVFVSFSVEEETQRSNDNEDRDTHTDASVLVVTAHHENMKTCMGTVLSSKFASMVAAVGCNCCSPMLSTRCYEIFKSLPHDSFSPPVAFVTYPNSGEIYDAATRTWLPASSTTSVTTIKSTTTTTTTTTTTQKTTSDFAAWFVDAFVVGDSKEEKNRTRHQVIIGGCCRTTPDRDITALRKVIDH